MIDMVAAWRMGVKEGWLNSEFGIRNSEFSSTLDLNYQFSIFNSQSSYCVGQPMTRVDGRELRFENSKSGIPISFGMGVATKIGDDENGETPPAGLP
jgi:hypothetical protein